MCQGRGEETYRSGNRFVQDRSQQAPVNDAIMPA